MLFTQLSACLCLKGKLHCSGLSLDLTNSVLDITVGLVIVYLALPRYDLEISALAAGLLFQKQNRRLIVRVVSEPLVPTLSETLRR